MVRNRRRVALVAGVAMLVCAIAGASAAIAAGGAFTLVSPRQGAHVRPGKIRLVIRDTVPAGFPLFVQISPRRKLNSAGHLAQCLAVRRRCDFVEAFPWRHHRGLWIWESSGVSAPGFWATTRGTYYWQAHYNDCSVTEVDSCRVVTRIGKFHVE
jgi:hypothetical protein